MPPENENPGECATCAGQSSNKIASRGNTVPNMIAYKPRGERGPTVYRDSTGISPEHMARLNAVLSGDTARISMRQDIGDNPDALSAEYTMPVGLASDTSPALLTSTLEASASHIGVASTVLEFQVAQSSFVTLADSLPAMFTPLQQPRGTLFPCKGDTDASAGGDCYEITGTPPYGPFKGIKKPCKDCTVDPPHVALPGGVVVNGIPVSDQAEADEWKAVCDSREKKYLGPSAPGCPGVEVVGEIEVPPHMKKRADQEYDESRRKQIAEACDKKMRDWEVKRIDDLWEERRAYERARTSALKAYSDCVNAAKKLYLAEIGACALTSYWGPPAVVVCMGAAMTALLLAVDACKVTRDDALKAAEQDYDRAKEKWANANPKPC